jgi:MbtH protein
LIQQLRSTVADHGIPYQGLACGGDNPDLDRASWKRREPIRSKEYAMLETDDADRKYQVLVNGEEQYSLWPLDKTPPTGWRQSGATGNRETCLTYVNATWTDMRPLSLRGETR